MNGFATTVGTCLVLPGSALQRGRGQAAELNEALADQVRAATIGRVEAARSEGWVTQPMLDYVAAQLRFAEAHDPHGIAELQGIADAFGMPPDDLFLHLHLGTLRDFSQGAAIETDGCSAWAVGQGPDGPLVVKNRDFSGSHLGVQRMAWHEGPDITTGGIMCLGSLGSPGAYSSGMNASGLALADTQIGTTRHRVGWLRYFLMTRILATCTSVAEALRFIQAVPHAGGGSLIIADASGASAAVELGAARVVAVEGAVSWRTNHFVSAELADQTMSRGGGRISANSGIRMRHLSECLPVRSWDIASAAALMSTHSDEGAPICQHPNPDDDTLTISSVIYAIAQRRIYLHEGNPCAGRWQHIQLP